MNYPKSLFLLPFCFYQACSALLFAQASPPDWQTIKDKDDKIVSKGKMVENKRVGEWRFYLSPISRYTQEADLVGDYSNGAKYNNWHFSETRNKILIKGKCTDDTPNGIWAYYDQKGNTLAKGELRNGIRHGQWQLYLHNTPIASGLYENGVRVGVWQYDYFSTDSSTQILGQFDFNNGQQTGKFDHYKIIRHPKFGTQKTLVGKGAFLNGKKTGRWIEYSQGFKGEMIETGYYDGDGFRTGAWQTLVDGKVFQETSYNDGQKQGSFTSYYESGKPKYITAYERGIEHGAFTAYYENGKIKEKGIHRTLEKEFVEDTLYKKIELPLEFAFRFSEVDMLEFNFNCIRWISDMDYSIPAEELQKRYEEALQYGKSKTLQIEKIRRTPTQAVRIGEYKKFFEDGTLHLEGEYYPDIKITREGNSTVRDLAKDGAWKEYDETGFLRKIYTYKQGELLKVVDGNGNELDKATNKI